MIVERNGDLLKATESVLCHQTNYQGVMGGGIALAIRSRLLSDSGYRRYVRFCTQYGHNALGKVQLLSTFDGRIVANCFCQNDWVSGYQEHETLTNYLAMERCFRYLKKWAMQNNASIAIPGYMGCGIAGGDWNRVKKIIFRVFSESEVPVCIYYFA